MIDLLTATDFRKALVDMIHDKAKIPYDVHFNHVNKSTKSYIWIELRPQKISWDRVYFQRVLGVYIYVILTPDNNAEIKHTDLMDISDKLDAAIMPCLQVEDRFITVQEFSSHIFDDVLHYEFTLDFTDCVESDEYEGLNYELMMNLEADLNRGTSQRVFIKETDEEEQELPDPSEVLQELLDGNGDD